MKLNHRQRITFRHTLRQANYWTKQLTKEQNANNGKGTVKTTVTTNMWRERFTRYYFKLHPDA